jgi:hypothetical protein
MAANYRTPGVYIEEVSKFPPSVVAVETAVPAFIGYTERTLYKGENLINRAVETNSLLDYETIFGLSPSIGSFVVNVDADGKVISAINDPNTGANARFRFANAIKHYFHNGGGRCYIISIGAYNASAITSDIVNSHLAGLNALAKEDEPTMIVMPDLSSMEAAAPQDAPAIAAVRASYHGVLIQALAQCAELGDRVLIGDLWDGDQAGEAGVNAFRDGMGTRNMKYGAIYHPFIRTTLSWRWDEDTITVAQLASREDDGSLTQPGTYNGMSLTALKDDAVNANPTIYGNVRQALDRFSVTLPPAATVAGVYCTVDRTRGVWKSPANESLAAVRSLTVEIDNSLNDLLNVDATGKSINAIRFFSGRGYMVWGARTLAGNDNEWRYVSVRRFFNMVEESTKKATEPFVFEPNDANTWTKVRAMIENFLILQWRAGALAGAKPEHAFYVRCGLGTTMTALDILEGRMHVEIGMAVVRPAEFIILQFSHKMQES